MGILKPLMCIPLMHTLMHTLNVHTLNVHLKIGGVEAMHFELKDEERKRLRKERRETGGLPSSMSQRAQPLIIIGVGSMRLTLGANTTPADRTWLRRNITAAL
jgi:hypothetical protein